MASEEKQTQRPWPRSLRALKHRNFQLFFAGQLISLTGTWMQSVAQSWLVYRLALEHPEEYQAPAAILGLVGFAGQIPVFLLALVGGMAADRFRRHRIVIGTQILSMLLALTLATLELSGVVQIWHVFVLASLLGVVNAFDIPARQAFVVDMVGREDIVNAVALNSSMFNGARVVGPAVAGILVASIGEGWCFLLNGLSYLAVLAGLLMMNVKRHEHMPLADSPLKHLLEGLRYVWTVRPIRALLALLALMSIMGVPYAVLMPIFADKILQGGAMGLGILMGSAGVGALLGALTLTTREGIKGLGSWVARASGGFGVALLVFSASTNFWLSAVALIPVGYCLMVTMASANTLVQSMAPDRLRGRVMSLYSMMFMGMAPFGALMAGGLADLLGPRMTVALGGIACIAGSSIFALRLPILRKEARGIILGLEMAAGQPAEVSTGEGATAALAPSKPTAV